MKIKSLAVSALLLASMSSAFAAPTPVTLTQIDASTYSGSFGLTHPVTTPATGFSDIFNFSPSFGGTLVSAYLSSFSLKPVLGNINFTSVTLNGQALTIGTGMLEVAYTPYEYALNGPLQLQVTGNGNGSYSGSINVTPVPEPETYGMLLAGLGLVGFVARRRAAKKAA